MKTCNIKPAQFTKSWVTVDAAGQTLGRLASQIAYVLRGKHKPEFTPNIDCGDNVIVLNAEKIKLTGNKWSTKVYYSHSSYIGGIKSITAKDLWKKNPEKIVEQAVKGMLPKNKIGRKMGLSLKVYAGTDHPHASQSPTALPERLQK